MIDPRESMGGAVSKNVPGGIAAIDNARDREVVKTASRRTTDVLGTDSSNITPAERIRSPGEY